jgi:hypothetical protein
MKKLEALLNLIIRIVIGLFGIFIISFPILLLIQGKDFAGREIEADSFVGIILLGCLAGIFFLAFAIRGSKPKNTTGIGNRILQFMVPRHLKKQGVEVDLDKKEDPNTVAFLVLAFVGFLIWWMIKFNE